MGIQNIPPPRGQKSPQGNRRSLDTNRTTLQAADVLWEIGIYTRNEWRQAHGREPLPEPRGSEMQGPGGRLTCAYCSTTRTDDGTGHCRNCGAGL